MTRITATIVVIVLAAIAIVWLWPRSDSEKVKGQSTQNESGQPRLELSATSADLGEMAVQDEKTATFTLKNTGTKALELKQFSTSCNCTFAQLKTPSQTSPMFNMMMHMPPKDMNWKTELQPNEEATLSVIYRPSLMPVYGPVQRFVTFETDDPEHKNVELTINATVK